MDYKEAVVIQKEMAQRVVTQDCIPKQINLVAGMDVSNSRFDPAKMIYAAGVLLSFADMQVQNVIHASLRQEFPYIPGLLGFREAPALQQVSAQLKILPDLIFVDGHGISHPRRLR